MTVQGTQEQYDAATAALKAYAEQIVTDLIPDPFQDQAKQAIDQYVPDGAKVAVDAALAVSVK